MKKSAKGYTLVELIIVMTIIIILAVIAIVVFVGIQNDARNAATSASLQAVYTQIEEKRIANQEILGKVTGNWCTSCACADIHSPACLTALSTTYITKLGMESLPLDGWGDPILIDENEMEGGVCGTQDHIWSINGQGSWVPFFDCRP